MKDCFRFGRGKDAYTSNSSSSSNVSSSASYRYKPLRISDESCTFYEPEKTSVGKFLNRRSSLRSKQGYGSTRERTFVDRYGRRSRDSLEFPDDFEFALKVRQRKKKRVVELKEFPLGYTKSYLEVDLDSQPSVVYDPSGDIKGVERNDWRSLQEPESVPRGCFPLCPTDLKSSLSGVSGRMKKARLRLKNSGKTSARVMYDFPSVCTYGTEFVQSDRRNSASTDVPERGPREGSASVNQQPSKMVLDLDVTTPRMSGKTLNYLADFDNKLLGTAPCGKTAAKEHVIDFDGPAAPREDPVKLTSDELGVACEGGNTVRGEEKNLSRLSKLKQRKFFAPEDFELVRDTEGAMGGENERVRGDDGAGVNQSEKSGLDSLASVKCEENATEPLAGIASPIRREKHRPVIEFSAVPKPCRDVPGLGAAETRTETHVKSFSGVESGFKRVRSVDRLPQLDCGTEAKQESFAVMQAEEELNREVPKEGKAASETENDETSGRVDSSLRSVSSIDGPPLMEVEAEATVKERVAVKRTPHQRGEVKEVGHTQAGGEASWAQSV